MKTPHESSSAELNSDGILCEKSARLIILNNLPSAESIIEGIVDDDIRSLALLKIVERKIELGDIKGAEETAKKLDSYFQFTVALPLINKWKTERIAAGEEIAEERDTNTTGEFLKPRETQPGEKILEAALNGNAASVKEMLQTLKVKLRDNTLYKIVAALARVDADFAIEIAEKIKNPEYKRRALLLIVELRNL